VPDYGDLPQINIIDSDEKHKMLNIVLCEHLLRNGNIDIADSLIKVTVTVNKKIELKLLLILILSKKIIF
jgi:hypothetical protein